MHNRQDHRGAGIEPVGHDGEVTARSGRFGRLGLAIELGKGGLSSFVVGTTLVGYLLASGGVNDWRRMLVTLLGTALTSSGTLALNQWMEIDADGRMKRTSRRPLPSGRASPARTLQLSLLTVAVGLALLAFLVNLLTAGLALVVVLLYLLVYTPAKPRSPLCTLVGALCGAIPPMMGWTAVTAQMDTGAWILAAILFLWQIPHFLSLAWLYRDDYARGGFLVLPVLDTTGTWTSRMVLLYTLALLPLGLTVTLIGMAGFVFLVGSLVLGLAFFALGLHLYFKRTDASARALFLASLVYLPALLSLMVANR